jgi:large subunit ribosomal protein L29
VPDAAELAELDDDELEGRLVEYRRELLNLRFQLATSQLDNPARLPAVRKDIARVMTLLREREIALAEGRPFTPVAPRPRRPRAEEEEIEEVAEDTEETDELLETDDTDETEESEEAGEDYDAQLEEPEFEDEESEEEPDGQEEEDG